MAGGTFAPTITIRWSRRGFDRLWAHSAPPAWPVAGRCRHRGVRGRSRVHGRDPCLRCLAQGQSSRPAAHRFMPGAGVHHDCGVDRRGPFSDLPTGTMFIDPHGHTIARTTDDYAAMEAAGVVAV